MDKVDTRLKVLTVASVLLVSFVLVNSNIIDVYAVASPVFSFKFGQLGTENGNFTSPQGISINSTGFVYVGDTGNNRIQIFNASGGFLKEFGSPGSGGGAP